MRQGNLVTANTAPFTAAFPPGEIARGADPHQLAGDANLMLGLLRINDLIDHRLVSLAKNAAAFFSRSRSTRNNSFSRRNRANSFCMSSCGPDRRSVSRLSDIHRVRLDLENAEIARRPLYPPAAAVHQTNCLALKFIRKPSLFVRHCCLQIEIIAMALHFFRLSPDR